MRHADSPLPTRDVTGTAVRPATLAPAEDGTGRHSPVRRYPWQEAYPALQRLMARASRHSPLTRLEYRNPITGGPALATLACLLEGMAAGTQTRPSRETASSVMVVARGTGTLTCGSHTFELHPNDVAAIPAWTWYQLATRGDDLVVFRMTDRPIHDAFGLYRTEGASTGTCPPEPGFLSARFGTQEPRRPGGQPGCFGPGRHLHRRSDAPDRSAGECQS